MMLVVAVAVGCAAERKSTTEPLDDAATSTVPPIVVAPAQPSAVPLDPMATTITPPPIAIAPTVVPPTALPAATVAADTTVAGITPVTGAPVTTGVPSLTTTSPNSTTSTTSSTLPDVLSDTLDIGRSVEGRPITAVRRGDPDGTVVLVIGVIHGDESAGLAIMDRLATLDVPDGIDLWLVDAMNPDGLFHDRRQNANGVDLNRNFPFNWAPLGQEGDWQYAGPSAGSEPETKAMVDFMRDLQPELVIWYHQDYYRISPAQGRDGEIRKRYAELTDWPLLTITGGTYTGVAATWARVSIPGCIAFIVELGAELSDDDADRHARAVLTVADQLDESIG